MYTYIYIHTCMHAYIHTYIHTYIQVIRDPAKHMCGEPVAVGPARIVMCDHDLERMDIVAGDVPYVCIRACEPAHHVPTVCVHGRQQGRSRASKRESVWQSMLPAGNGVHVQCQKSPSRVFKENY